MVALMYVKFLHRLSRNRILMHFCFWIAVMVFCFFNWRTRSVTRTLEVNLTFLPAHLFFVYALNYLLLPYFILKGKIWQALPVFLVILSISMFWQRFADVILLHYSGGTRIWEPRSFARLIYALFSIGWIAVTIRLVKYWYIEKEIQQKLEKEKLMVELELLKSQLHPHFLFNTLNNLYSLTLERSEQASHAVLRLSSLLRYILYECNQPYIFLSEEIAIIRNYVELEQMRFRERLDVSLRFTGDIEGKVIAPLLLLPFVENSIKHGTSEQLEKSWISLDLHVEGDLLTLKLINSRDEDADSKPHEKQSGLGLQNVWRRLNLLYPGQHTLKVVPETDTYLVSLAIRLTSQPTPKKYHETQMSFS